MRHRPPIPALLLTVLGLPVASAADTIPLASLDLAPMTQEYGRPAVDRTVDGHPLRIGGRGFAHGLGTHAASQLTIRVDHRALRFHAHVGVDDEGPGGTVEFRVVGDGKTLWSSGIVRAGQPAREVDVALTGVALLALETDATADGNKDDHADWAEAELVMEAGAQPTTVADPTAERDAGAGERTPSHAQYFTWINNTNEGATEAQTLTNLAFFAWLRDEYGMQLDIYAWDAGNLDVPRGYGTTDSARFRAQYPRGWRPIADAAGALGCRLGLWGGPDGFGDTPEQAAARIALMSGLCRDYRMAEFKFDGVCGQLRPEKQDYFVQMMQACRKFSPDLVLLNHRLPLGKGLRYATTFLFEGAETYIDVHMANSGTAPHHRAGALARGLPPHLTRLTEDHGVCISSCLDAWDDDLVLQAFNRSLILAPEIYGNPWFLRDDEYPKLARIYNLHRRWRDLLTQGVILPEADYGPHAVARGDAATRVVTLRNLGWEPRTYQVKLDEGIGLSAAGAVTVRLFHPHERILGTQAHGGTVPVTVAPFSVALLLATTVPCAEPGVSGCDAEVVRDVPGKPLVLRLLGLPGTTATATFAPGRVAARVRDHRRPAAARLRRGPARHGGLPGHRPDAAQPPPPRRARALRGARRRAGALRGDLLRRRQRRARGALPAPLRADAGAPGAGGARRLLRPGAVRRARVLGQAALRWPARHRTGAGRPATRRRGRRARTARRPRRADRRRALHAGTRRRHHRRPGRGLRRPAHLDGAAHRRHRAGRDHHSARGPGAALPAPGARFAAPLRADRGAGRQAAAAHRLARLGAVRVLRPAHRDRRVDRDRHARP